MPFKSIKQLKYLRWKEPKIYKRWAKRYGIEPNMLLKKKKKKK